MNKTVTGERVSSAEMGFGRVIGLAKHLNGDCYPDDSSQFDVVDKDGVVSGEKINIDEEDDHVEVPTEKKLVLDKGGQVI